MTTLKVTILAALAALSAGSLQAQTKVRAHTRSDGTYVPEHYRSRPNSSTYDNWSTRGNTNPYTGKPGYRDPWRTPGYFEN
ncbi:MAG TPA: hypothetical protein VFH87_01680 [Candidatus Udaeobacter sp.]|nr:hypothetical protein [Candidatus Udaeobacter sp.]